MLKSVIKVQNLSKRYRIGLEEKHSETLAGQIGNILKSPFQNFKKLQQMSRFGEEDESVFWALNDINFQVKEGEVLGIIGKNGAGKSTLLKILSQITQPTSGKIEIHGRVASLLEVGTGFHPELSGRENIYMNGTILGMTRREIDSKLDEIIDFSGIEKFIDTPVKFYSSGMNVRLGFSVAAHLEPEILIIDEVLAVGDFEFQAKCLGKMRDVSRQGRTVLFVSHNLEAVKTLCDRAILLENGHIVFDNLAIDTVKFYLKKNSFSLNSMNWIPIKRPGNEWLRVNKIEISNKGFQENGFFERMHDLTLITEFELLKNSIATNLSMFICSDTGEIIFNSYSQLPVPILNKGVYSSTCIIPGGLLNDGSFTITMLFVKDTSIIMFSLENVLRFELVDTEIRGTGWHGKFPGYVRPKLDFKIHV
ncbi:lipopolysaccharide transport system ATP-binding protein [Algoriphagus alkaliphilus]|uniref:Lipopolysaccharide transport system ATP-binding protein n=1 Tax=Algoriphagus alkaliphilus TaxID=279824 RepID=A0A1G5ZPX4_9BACT|nr:ABC transporter ATP-binding protein [Algoriphagus alkaliphilus]SDA96363.1 lipopolysaccharide transport system ATP-binding protein [Algoriphagus alkaliphilus]